MGWQGNFTEKFSTEVLQRLKMPKKTIAYHLGVPYKTFYNWVMGIVAFPPDLIAKLYQITKDARIFQFFLHPCNFIPLEDPFGKGRELVERALKDIKELWEFLDYDQNKKEE